MVRPGKRGKKEEQRQKVQGEEKVGIQRKSEHWKRKARQEEDREAGEENGRA